MIESDTYNTIKSPSEEVLFKDKNSKFFGYAFPIESEDDAKTHVEQLKKKHHSARHLCYAYQLGTENMTYRTNDDGEPSNSAGAPIYGQILSFNVTNILIVVVRYFGGVKLGVGGLINAYKTSAQLALEQSNIITKTIHVEYHLTFEYKTMNKVMRIIKEKKIDVLSQILELDCQITISIRKKDAQSIFHIFDNVFGIKIKAV